LERAESMSDKPIFERKVGLGQGIWIYEDKVVISEGIGKKVTIPMGRIAAVGLNMVGTISIETTGGKNYRLLLGKFGKRAKEVDVSER
jgi:hypothetical protein